MKRLDEKEKLINKYNLDMELDENRLRELNLVIDIASDYLNYGLDLDDLVQEGLIGLMYAKKNKLNYNIYINKSIEYGIASYIGIPSFTIKSLLKINRFNLRYFMMHGEYPDNKTISKMLNMKEEKVDFLVRVLKSSNSSFISRDEDYTLSRKNK